MSVATAAILTLAIAIAGHGASDISVPPAYRTVARAHAVPERLLFAIALQESGTTFGGRFVPWPWTLNLSGEPRRYPTRRQACAALTIAMRSMPVTRIDVGLGQISVGFHGHRVEQPCDLLDPLRNLQLTAAILREQYARTGDWHVAAGHYHRPAGGDRAAKYRARVERHLLRLAGKSNRGATP